MSQSGQNNTRTAILDAAVTEFWVHGYRGASVRGICKRANASSNAVTYHFGSKKQLYREILDRFAVLQVEQAQLSLSGELRSQEEFRIRLEMFLARLLETYLENRETLLIALREFEQLEPQNEEPVLRDLVKVNVALSAFVERARDQGLVRDDVDADIVAGTLLDRLLSQARYAHTHKQFFEVTSLDADYRSYWVRTSVGLILDGIKPRAAPETEVSN